MSTGAITSTSWVPGPLYACLKKADEALGRDRIWQGSTPGQREFLASYRNGVEDLGLLSDDEFQARISPDESLLNEWLKRNGFDVELAPLGHNEFGTAAIVRLSAEWIVQGRSQQFQMEDGIYRPGVVMTEDAFSAFESSAHPHPIARIKGTNGSEWYLTKAAASLEGLELFGRLRGIRAMLQPSSAGRLMFPKVDFEQRSEPDVMIGLETFDDRHFRWRVSQAVQQTRIKMNELGGLAESGAAAGMRSTSVKPAIVIDGPMWLWIAKPAMRLPMFTAQFGYDAFKDPGQIEFGRKVLA